MNTASSSRSAAATTTRQDSRWAAVVARDAATDGQFFYSVSTTGVYCRPSCASRAALPENVRFHATAADAEQAGFRPCKRCRPDQPSWREQQALRITDACRRIEAAEEMPSLGALAESVGMSPYHFHRVFKALLGITPRAYANARRGARLRETLAASPTVTDAIFDAGYNSNGRFYENADGVLGMTPTRWRSGGAGSRIHFAIGECSLGAILVARSERGICAILLGDEPQPLIDNLRGRFPQADLVGDDAAFADHMSTVVGFVEAPGIGLNLPLDLRGTAFQQRVWQALTDIPVGTTASYAEIAQRIGQPRAVRAVAAACAANPVAVAIPCHRVVRHDGGLSGYRWGVERKRALLAREHG